MFRQLFDKNIDVTEKDKIVKDIIKTLKCLPEVKGNSDIVYEIGEYSVFDKIFRFRHIVYETGAGQGWGIIGCRKTHKYYLHFLLSPCKFTILCRGCGNKI